MNKRPTVCVYEKSECPVAHIKRTTTCLIGRFVMYWLVNTALAYLHFYVAYSLHLDRGILDLVCVLLSIDYWISRRVIKILRSHILMAIYYHLLRMGFLLLSDLFFVRFNSFNSIHKCDVGLLIDYPFLPKNQINENVRIDFKVE